MASRHYIDFELLDYSGSKSSFSVYNGAITALSLPGFLTQLGALRTALAGITIGTISKERWVGDETILSSVPPANSEAQRELRWWIDYYEDASPYPDHLAQIACPDMSLLDTNSDWADYSNPAIAAFITAFETIVVGEVTGAAVIVERMQIAGVRYG